MARYRLHLVALFLIPAMLSAESVSYVSLAAAIIEERLALASPDNATRFERLQKLFGDSGCTGDRLQEQVVSKKGQPNVICTLPGDTESAILIGAHFDTKTPSAGVADNWSGAALLPSLFEALKHTRRKHTYIFVGFTDEEKGLLGSKHFVSKLSKEAKINIAAMINIDTLGLSAMNVWVSHSDKKLVDMLFGVASVLKVDLRGLEMAGVGTTDSESFAFTKIPRIAISSVTRSTLPILHSKADVMKAMDLPVYYDSYKTLCVYLTYLDQKL